MNNRRHDALAIALLLLLPTLYFGDVLIGINNFYMRDLTRYYYPTKQILREIVLGGEFPYWNRYFSAGQPIAANPEHEVFYPLTWLILLPSYNLGYRLHILIHIYIGLLGMYALLRSMELRPVAAVFGAMAFGLGGVYLSYVNLLPILFCAAWLPLTCLFVRRFLLYRRARDFALASLFLGLEFLVAEPTTVIQTGLLIGMYALYRSWNSAHRVITSIVNVLWIAAISIAAFLVGCAQMLPALDHVADSARSRPFEFSLVEAWSMPWAKFAEVIYPNILGHISVKNVMWYYGGGLYSGMGSPFLFNIYCGLAVTALAIAGAFMRPRGGRFVLLIVVVSVVLALGGNTPVLKLLYDAHIATTIRYPEKFILMAMFAAIIFAAQTLQRALDGDAPARDTAAGFTLAATVVAAIIGAISFTHMYSKIFMKVWGLTAGGAANYMIRLSQIDWSVAAVRGALLTALLLTIFTRRRVLWLVLALLFVCADLGVVCWELNPRMPRRFFTEPPELASKLPPNRADYRLFHEADWYGQEEVARQYFSTGDAVYWVVRNGLFPMTPVGWKVHTVLERDYDKTALLPTVDLVASIWDVKRSGREDWYQPFMAMSNAWYRAIYRTFEEEKKRVGGNFKKAKPVGFIDEGHNPRYYFADQLVRISDRHDFVKKLSTSSYSRRAAFVGVPTFVPAKGVIRSVRETANDTFLDVESFGRGFLVMSITPHKYWRMTLDGRPIDPVITNIGYQGAVIPSGRHRIAMRYRNTLVQRGAIVSMITAGTLLLVAVFARSPREIALPPAIVESPQ
ncbi:MAG TPA: hypothetical protein VGK31_07125 [Thermoanaerobaculia bacterium]